MDSKIRKIQGSRKAQEALYDEYSGLVMGICCRYLRDPDTAADAFQEAFIKVFQNIQQVKEYKALPGWVRRIAVNTAIDHLKSGRYAEPISSESHEMTDQFYSDLLDKMTEDAILDLIDELPEGYRVIFNLYVVDGYSHKEIAEQLKISEGTSRSQLVCARKLLKKKLNQLGITRYEHVI